MRFYIIGMIRDNRTIISGLPHYITRQGCHGDPVFREPTDYRVFLHLLAESCERNDIAIWGYSVMSRGYSLVLVPSDGQAFDAGLRHVDAEYAHYHNLRHMVRKPVWDVRYESVAMCWSRVWDAIVYVEREPVRKHAYGVAWAHPWSSATARLGQARRAEWLNLEEWSRHWDVPKWMSRLQHFESESQFGQELSAVKRSGAALGEMVVVPERIQRMEPRRAATRRTPAAMAVGG